MGSIDIRPCGSQDDLKAAISSIFHAFGNTPGDQTAGFFARTMTPQRALVAWDGERIAGGMGSYALDLTVPGGRVPTAGVSMVGVMPTHRRRGVLSAMMREEFAACRGRGEPLAYLWASEDGIYNRFGYGLAALCAEIKIARERTGFATPFSAPGEFVLVPPEQAEPDVAVVYASVLQTRPGLFARNSVWWKERLLTDSDWRRAGGGELRCVIYREHGVPLAYAFYRMNFKMELGIQTGHVSVVEAFGVDAQATAAIWRFLFDLDWTSLIRAPFLPVDHPIFMLAAEPRRLRAVLRDATWLRIVDVEAALKARQFEPGPAVVIEIADALCPWNAGGWRISADGIARTADAPDLRCDVSTLASAYLGGFSWRQLAESQRAESLQPGATEQAEALFGHHPAPWCPEIF